MSSSQVSPGPRPRRHLARALRAALVVVGLLPFLPRVLSGVPVLSEVGSALEAWFGFQCHRDPARSLTLFGELLPVCTRCFAIYVGLGLGALLLWPRPSLWGLRLWVGLAALGMLLDVASEALGLRPPWAGLRAVTGLLLAYPVGVALVLAARGEEPGAGEGGALEAGAPPIEGGSAPPSPRGTRARD